jgi:hypothetical protein
VDAAQALADLTEVSAQIEAAVVADESGAPLASTLAAEEATKAMTDAGLDLFREAGDGVVQVETATPDGGVFAVRESGRVVVAVARAGAPSGLVLYDLRTCLRRLLEEEPEKPKPRRPRKKKADDEVA